MYSYGLNNGCAESCVYYTMMQSLSIGFLTRVVWGKDVIHSLGEGQSHSCSKVCIQEHHLPNVQWHVYPIGLEDALMIHSQRQWLDLVICWTLPSQQGLR